jgi:hypothetical protein
MMIVPNDPELIDAILQNIYITLSVYKQKEKEYRLFANADKGHFYTLDKDRFMNKANEYKRLIDELNAMKSDIVSDIRIIKQKCV